MWIEKLEIKGFGKLNQASFHFTNGLNVIFGTNEAGKTSLQTFIKAMFYGLKNGRNSKEGSLPLLKRYKPWGVADYSGSMEYRSDSGEIYRIERNFSNNTVRVYDSFFHEITGQFEMSKEKGVQFAEKHLGISEACFHKTVFVKQMDSKVDGEGNHDLLDKLMNISQTGSEDVSLIKAQAALKEALLKYIGTDKTSTRPMDIVLGRIHELKSNQKVQMEKQNSLFQVESDLSRAKQQREDLEKKRRFLGRCKTMLELRNGIELHQKNKGYLRDIVHDVQVAALEIQMISEQFEIYSQQSGELAKLSLLNEEDADNLGLTYYKFLDLMKQNRSRTESIQQIKEEICRVEYQLESLKAFAALDEDAGNEIIRVSKELEDLESEYKSSRVELLNEQVNSEKYKCRMAIYGFCLSVAYSFGSILLDLVKSSAGYFLLMPGLAAALFFWYRKGKKSREVSRLENEKWALQEVLNRVHKDMNEKERKLKNVLNAVGAENVEEFLKKKDIFDYEVQRLTRLNSELDVLENNLESDLKNIAVLRNEIGSKLMNSGIIHTMEDNIAEEHITAFQHLIRNYIRLKPEMNYTTQRMSDLNRRLQDNYLKASEIGCRKCGSIDEINKLIVEADDRISTGENELNRLMQAIHSDIQGFEDSSMDPDSFMDQLSCSKLEEGSILIDDEDKKALQEYHSTLLKVKEYEILLKSFMEGDDSIQKIEEELEELENRKDQLEGVDFSLRTALDVLSESSAELKKDYIPVLNEKMGGIMKNITSGKYTDIRADGNLLLRVIAPETGEVVPIGALSGGTMDQIYFALRVSMGELISASGEKLPLIMDEVFAQYDDIRTRETLLFLYELSKNTQLMLFTCKGREVDIAREVCGNQMNIISL